MEIYESWVVAWLIAVCVTAVAVTAWDKNRARRREWRIAESTLWLIAVLGGSAAMYATMLFMRHKTRHRSFMIGLPLLIVAQAAFFVVACNRQYLVFV